MTVDELIQQLQSLDPDLRKLPVGIMGPDYNITLALWVGYQNVRYESPESVRPDLVDLTFPTGCDNTDVFLPVILIRSV